MKTVIYHNQNCSKSCSTLNTLQELKVDLEVVEYLKTPPSAEKLKEIISMLGIRAEDLVRKTEPVYLEKFSDKNMNNQQWILAMVEFPELIERPIVVHGNRAVIGRPVGKVIELLKHQI